MQGIQFITDDLGNKTAVILDLKEHGELWEDIYDILLAQSRIKEPRESLEEVKEKLQDQGKLSGWIPNNIVDIIAVRHRSEAYDWKPKIIATYRLKSTDGGEEMRSLFLDLLKVRSHLPYNKPTSEVSQGT